jgi:hypothetical protein
MDDLKRRSTAALSKSELDKLQGDKKDKEIDKDSIDSTRITRLKAQQIATGIIVVSCPIQMNMALKFISSCPNKEKVVRLEVLIVVLLKIQVFYDVKRC